MPMNALTQHDRRVNIVLSLIIVGIYRVSSSKRTRKGHRSQPDLKSIHQYF